MSYNQQQLKGLKIDHNFNQFEEGKEVILTLKDELIVDQLGNLIEKQDILENIEMQQNEKYDQIQKEKDKLKRRQAYDQEYVEDRYSNVIEKRGVLEKYDEKQVEKQGIVLDEEGIYNLEKMNKLQAIKEKLKKSSNKNVMDLNIEKKLQSEYFEKPKPKKTFQKKQVNKQQSKSMRELIDFLEENAEDEENFENYGNRQRQQNILANEEFQDQMQKKVKKEQYEHALEKAKEEQKINNLKFNLLDDDEEEQLQKALFKTKKQQQKQNQNQVELVVQQYIAQNQKLEEENKLQLQDYNMLLQQESTYKDKDGRQEIKTIINSTEFLKNIQTHSELDENIKKIIEPTRLNLKDSKDGTTSVVNVSLPSEKLVGYTKKQSKYDGLIYKSSIQQVKDLEKQKKPNGQIDDKDSDGEDIEKMMEENPEKLAEEVGFIQETAVGNSLANTLQMLRERGELQYEGNEFVGRANDRNPVQELAKFGESKFDKVKLEYRDRNGKLMTQKEAFRYMCHIFHGKEPSKNKKDKKLKKDHLIKQGRFQDPSEAPLMKALKQSQQKSNLPYMNLSVSRSLE